MEGDPCIRCCSHAFSVWQVNGGTLLTHRPCTAQRMKGSRQYALLWGPAGWLKATFLNLTVQTFVIPFNEAHEPEFMGWVGGGARQHRGSSTCRVSFVGMEGMGEPFFNRKVVCIVHKVVQVSHASIRHHGCRRSRYSYSFPRSFICYRLPCSPVSHRRCLSPSHVLRDVLVTLDFFLSAAMHIYAMLYGMCIEVSAAHLMACINCITIYLASRTCS